MDGWVWGLAATVTVILAIDLVVRAFAVGVALPIFERRPPFQVAPAIRSPAAEPIRFPTADGLTLAGTLYHPVGEPRGLVVFCPEFEGSHWQAPAYAGGLIEAGFAVLSFDFRNQGESESLPGYVPSHWLTDHELEDAASALRFAAGRPDLRELPVGLFGVSRGGNAALAAAARSPDVRAVAAEGAFSTDGMMIYYTYRWAELFFPHWVVRLLPEWHVRWTMRIVRRISQWRRGVRYTILEKLLPRLAGRPVLLVAGGRDSYVAPAIADRLRALVGPTCKPVWVVPGAKHNQARPTAPEEYDRRLAAFFNQMATRGPQKLAPATR